MSDNSTITVANLAKWSTVMMLFVVCGCLFINIRSQHVSKAREIQVLKDNLVSLSIAIQNVDADIKRNLAPRVLEARLQAYNSTLRAVGVEHTEELIPEMTALR
ncbi:MAG: hypothetical protein ACI8T1_001816 [Verrucomicrobiales bacterium]|jgi:hypothetical protein